MRRFALQLSLLLALGFLSGCQVVEDGTLGISKSFGKITDDPLLPGVYVNVPLIREVEVWNVKTQRRTLRLDVPSSEGLIVRLETTVLFRPQDVVAVRKNIGVNYINTVLDSTLTDTFREVIGQERVEDVIKNQENLTAQAGKVFIELMAKRSVIVEQLLVTDLDLPPKFKDAIERKLESEQKSFQKEFELQQAKKEAEIKIALARGQAESQTIVTKTLSPAYLQYLWVSTLNENPNVIYVATEANMPVLRTSSAGTK